MRVCWVVLDTIEIGTCMPLLSRGERDSAARYRSDEAHSQFVARRGWVRQVLGAWLGQPPDALELVDNEFGRPMLRDGGLAFSVATSRGVSLLAYGALSALGCDLERHDPALDALAIAARFSPEERAQLSALSPDRRLDQFYRSWTAKEAYAKAAAVALDEVLELSRLPRGWRVRHFSPLPGHHAAVVARGTWRLVLPDQRAAFHRHPAIAASSASTVVSTVKSSSSNGTAKP